MAALDDPSICRMAAIAVSALLAPCCGVAPAAMPSRAAKALAALRDALDDAGYLLPHWHPAGTPCRDCEAIGEGSKRAQEVVIIKEKENGARAPALYVAAARRGADPARMAADETPAETSKNPASIRQKTPGTPPPPPETRASTHSTKRTDPRALQIFGPDF